MNENTFDDRPIEKPEEDLFGINPLACSIAKSIQKLKSPNGTVIALNGPWGSGKSSAINLVRSHLNGAIAAQEIEVIDFACWWFRGEEALMLAFFRELYAGLGPSISNKFKEALPKLGARLLRTGPIIGGAADILGAGGFGSVAGKAMEYVGDLIKTDESVEKLHKDLSAALQQQSKRFLVVIDDIDRLSPDEALLIFSLVKSIGRLPNVIYLLAFDRELSEKIVSERYPSEGPHYLEKIVQAAFDIPEPSEFDLRKQLIAMLQGIFADVELADEKAIRFMNLFNEGVLSEIRTPRDVARLGNALSITWPAVQGEVDPTDFMMLEVLRLRQPNLYRAIRQNKDLLCKKDWWGDQGKEAISKVLNDTFLVEDVSLHEGHKVVLMRLFPYLTSIWRNYGSLYDRSSEADRRVCSESYFDHYFRFAVGENVLPANELKRLIDNIETEGFIAETLRNALVTPLSKGGTKAQIVLLDLMNHATSVPEILIKPLLVELFKIADELDVDDDREKGFAIADNQIRLHWLIRRLTFDRLSLENRSTIFTEACQQAPLGWLADFVTSTWNHHHPEEGKATRSEEECLTTLSDAEQLRELLKVKIEKATQDGSLIRHKDLMYLLYRWRELLNGDGETVIAWTSEQLDSDEAVECFAKVLTTHGWTQALGGVGSLGDTVARRSTDVRLKGSEDVIDVEKLLRRVEELYQSQPSPVIKIFFEICKKQLSNSE